MSDFSDQPSPFDMPAEVSPDAASASTRAPLPGLLRVICIIALVLGGLGALAALASGVGLLVGERAQAALNQPGPAGGPELAKLQQQMQKEINAIARRYVVLTSLAAVIHLASAVLLLVGATMTLRRRPHGPGLLAFGCGVAILYLIGEFGMNIVIQLQSLPIYQKLGDAIMDEATRQAGGQAPGMPNFMMIMVIVGLVMVSLLSLAKIIFYLFSIVYLRKPKIRSLFASEGLGDGTALMGGSEYH